MTRRPALTIVAAAIAWLAASPAAAQAPREPRFGYRAFFDVAPQAFAAPDTFKAVLGSSSGLFLGGGGQARWKNLLVEVELSRYKESGERVFISQGEVFHLGIPATVTLRPIDVTAAYRLPRLWRLRPYAGGGIGTQRYTETSGFASDGEDVERSSRSYHVVAGTEISVWRWFAAAAEVRYRTVADAIGDSGASKEYGEDNLGGTSVRLRVIVVGR